MKGTSRRANSGPAICRWRMVSPQRVGIVFLSLLGLAADLSAQSVCLPAPRLLTTMPMGGQSGTTVEVTIKGDHLEDADQLAFSDPRITATPKRNAAGEVEPNQYIVTIAPDCPPGIHEARVMTRLGMSTSRAFSVGTLPELSQQQPNTSASSALELPVNSICNGNMTAKAVDHYAFTGRKGQRIIVDCAAAGIDSKLQPVVVIADAEGRDLLVERRGGVLDFAVPADGRYLIKVHELTFKGGHGYFYRLGLWELPEGKPIVRQAATQPVHSFSWPPEGLPENAASAEVEPNNQSAQAQKITLPCDLAGSFYPAADVDVFEFEAKKGDEWWVEVASERLDLPTDPTVLIQHVKNPGGEEVVTDIAELTDIPSPVKVSSNGYAYDGPPYNAGSSDVLGKVVIKEDGVHRLRLADLFGGTRNDPRNIYRLVIRKAAPDFAVVAWALHMELRNGDRNALSKPLALRGGATMALEVVAVRRDGFDGEIELNMEGLPPGVSAHGLNIPAGQSRGMMLVTASQDAPRGLASARLLARAKIGDATVTRPCRVASMAWPVPDAWSEIPSPRLLADVPVSVSGVEYAPLTVSPFGGAVRDCVAGEKVTIPLMLVRRSEFSGTTMQLKTMGAACERAPAFDIALDTDSAEAVLDLATLKTGPGEHRIAFYGSAVARYRHRPDLVKAAEEEQAQAEQAVAAAAAEKDQLAQQAAAAAVEAQENARRLAEEAAQRHQEATKRLAAAVEKVKQATTAAQPKDIVDIVVSEPITLRVKAPEKP